MEAFRILTRGGPNARLQDLPRSEEQDMTGDPPSTAQLQSLQDTFTRRLANLGRVRSYPKNQSCDLSQ